VKDDTQCFIEKMKNTFPAAEEREIVKKAERTLEIVQLSQSQEEIDDAMKSLKEATDDMEEAEKYHEASKDNHTHLEYLNDFLLKQVEQKEPSEAIQMTIFRIQQVKDDIEESHLDELSENSIDKESDDEYPKIKIPVIPYQNNDLINNFEIETDGLDNDKNHLDDGQKTPTSSGSNSKSVNIAQQMLEKALKFQSPKEKMDRMKVQAKLNAKLRSGKIEKDRLTQELNKKSSELKICDNEEDQIRKDSKKSKKSEEEKNIITKKKLKSKKSKSEVKLSSATFKTKSKKNRKVTSTSDSESKSEMDMSVSTSESEYMSDETSNSEEKESENE